MPEHIDESRLIRLVSGELPEETRERAEGHIVECPVCRDRYETLRATWELLGSWQPAAPPGNLVPVIQRRAAEPRVVRRWASIGGLAAAVAVAMLTGAVAGRFAAARQGGPVAGSKWSADTVTDALGLAEWGDSQGLGGLFGEESEPGDEIEEVP